MSYEELMRILKSVVSSKKIRIERVEGGGRKEG